MDTALTRVEKKKLCFLLDLPPQCYGNVPMMKSRYKRACLKLHPDKGGEDLLMKELNMLWQKFQEGIFNLRRDIPSFEEVSTTHWEVCPLTLADFIANGYRGKFCLSAACLNNRQRESLCKCICCKLHRQHCSLKILRKKNCLVWGECFCYWCFLEWFGFPNNWESFDWWQKILEETEFELLHLRLY
ncbi:small T antigen [Eidolon polyomavirus 1]|uniref:Small T antigen n=1 Tax=Eidolon polyomavirus 1 TaxID=1891722 RepID=L0GC38_9POLY|nr:small T antigen [Eidolon polyomavirus 1]AGA82591.1 small T antigen [Eidolon polyomavirus 1]